MLIVKDNILFIFSAVLITVYGFQMPENVAVVEGNVTVMTIETIENSFITWLEYVTKPTGISIYNRERYIYQGDQGRGSRYHVEVENSGSSVFHRFSISNVELSDGGKYGAQDKFAQNGYAQLIVLNDNIECNISPNPVEADSVVTINCTINYQGKWAPVMTCSSTELTASSTKDLTTSGNAAIRFSGTTPSGPSDVNVSCETHFENPASVAEVGQDEAVNIPSYTSTWTGSVNVLFPATNITITPVQSEFDVNDVLTCRATGGNPEPSYEWIDLNKTSLLSGTAELLVNSNMAGTAIYVRCTATTNVLGVKHELEIDTHFYVELRVPATIITITPVQSVFEVNEVLTCSATGGNPEPSYEWIDLNTASILSRTAELLVNQSMAAKAMYVRCTATTNVLGVKHELEIEKRFYVELRVPATNITITPVQSVFEAKEVLTCRATGGNPEPSYEWIDLNTTSILSRTAELLVNKSMVGKVIYVRCKATTDVLGVKHELEIEKLFSVEPPGWSNNTVICIAVSTTLAVFGLIAAVLIVLYRMKKAQRARSRSNVKKWTPFWMN